MLAKLNDVSVTARDVAQEAKDPRGPMEVSGDALLTIGLDGAVTQINEAMIKIIGLTREKLAGTDFTGWFTEPDLARALCPLALTRGFVSDYALTVRQDNGHESKLLFNASVHNGPEGNPLSIFLVARDVSATRTSELQFRTFFESAPDAMVLINADGTILLMNGQTERLFGHRREDLLGKAVEILVPERFRDAHPGHRSAFFRESRMRPMGIGLDLWGLRKDGSEFPIEISLSPIESPRGLTAGATIRDVTLQKTASQYARSLLEASLDPLVTISPDGKITDVNQATIKVTGVAREKLVGTYFSDYFTEPQRALDGYQQVFAKGFVTDYPLTIRHENGRLTDVLYNASTYKDARGNVLGVFAAARDVTESQRVIREFSETKTLLDNIFQSSTRYSIVGKDLEHRVVSWNEGARRNYQYSDREIIGRNAQILHTPEDIASGAVGQMVATAYEKGVAEGEYERVRKDGSRFWASVVITRRNDAAGKPIGYLLMSNDISERKRAEDLARATSAYARSLIEASLDPLVTISPQGKITDVNEATIKVTGVPREALVGTDFSDYFTEPAQAREGYKQAFANGSLTDFPLTIRHQDHTLTEVTYNGSVYKDTRGNVLGVVAAGRDVTAQKRAVTEIVERRAKDLERLVELERFQKLTVGRELRMIELKKEIEELKRGSAKAGVE